MVSKWLIKIIIRLHFSKNKLTTLVSIRQNKRKLLRNSITFPFYLFLFHEFSKFLLLCSKEHKSIKISQLWPTFHNGREFLLYNYRFLYLTCRRSNFYVPCGSRFEAFCEGLDENYNKISGWEKSHKFQGFPSKIFKTWSQFYRKWLEFGTTRYCFLQAIEKCNFPINFDALKRH
jgi:hypothetical protein